MFYKALNDFCVKLYIITPANSNPDIISVGAVDRCGYRSGKQSAVTHTCDPWPTTGSEDGSNFGTELDIVTLGTNVPTAGNSVLYTSF